MKFIFAILLAFSPQAKDKPCTCVPTPHIHIDVSNGGFHPSATCPAGFEFKVSQKAADEYNNHKRTQAAAVNMLADASCVRKA